MELLKQPLCHPLSMPEQVITLCAATGKVLLDIPTEEIKEFQNELLNFFHEKREGIIEELATTASLGDELREQIVEGAKEFKTSVWKKNTEQG